MNSYKKLELQRKTNRRKEEYKYFVGTTLKNPLEYKTGEKIVFKIRVRYMDEYLEVPYINYSLLSDDGQDENGYIKASEDGWFYIEGSVSVSGFLYIRAEACDENKEPIEGIAVYNGSAGADINKLFRAAEVPGDYIRFWDKLKSEVEKTEPEVLYCEKRENEAHKDYEIYDMRVRAPRSDYAAFTVSYPKNAKEGSLKLAMFFQGYGVNPTFPRPLEGYMTVCVNAHSIPNGEKNDFYSELFDNGLKGYGFDAGENESPETTYWVKMLLRDMQALSYIKDHKLLNKKDYYFIGSSQGGMQAMNMAAHFEKSTAVIMNVPWLSDVHGDELAGRRANSMPKGNGVTYFDTAVAAEFLKCPAYIISGLGDPTCNSATQMALFNAIKSPKYIEFYQNKVHSFTIPWDNNMYALGEMSLADKYKEHTSAYYDWD